MQELIWAIVAVRWVLVGDGVAEQGANQAYRVRGKEVGYRRVRIGVAVLEAVWYIINYAVPSANAVSWSATQSSSVPRCQ